MNNQLIFDGLYNSALKDWPYIIDLSELQQALPDLSRYSVKGLGLLSDDIEEKYIGKENEIIWRGLNSAIFEVIHTIAKTVVKVEKNTIRPEAVRLIFEKRLKQSAESNSLNWLPEDYALVVSYFSQNSSQK